MNWLETLEEARRRIQQEQRQRMIALHRQLTPHPSPAERRQNVVGGEISRDPINRQAARLLSRETNWIALPPPDKPPPPAVKSEEPKPKRKRKKQHMKTEMSNAPVETGSFGGETVMFGGYEIKGTRGANGELLFQVSDLNRVMLAMAKELPEKSIPILERAKDAREAVNELLAGLGHDMTTFETDCKAFLEGIRQTRMSMVAETSQMSKSLRDVRQFFLASDYKEQISRLQEFVELCERLVTLKRNGALDALADTILKLAV